MRRVLEMSVRWKTVIVSQIVRCRVLTVRTVVIAEKTFLFQSMDIGTWKNFFVFIPLFQGRLFVAEII